MFVLFYSKEAISKFSHSSRKKKINLDDRSLFLSSDPVRVTWHSSCFSVQIPSSQYARTCVHDPTHRYHHTHSHMHIYIAHTWQTHAHTWQTHSPCTQTHAIKYSIPSYIITLTHQAHTHIHTDILTRYMQPHKLTQTHTTHTPHAYTECTFTYSHTFNTLNK